MIDIKKVREAVETSNKEVYRITHTSFYTYENEVEEND